MMTEVGRNMPWNTLRGSNVSAALGTVAITCFRPSMKRNPVKTRRNGWLIPPHSREMRSTSGVMSLPGTSAASAIRAFRKSRSTGPAIRRSPATTTRAATARTTPTVTRAHTRKVRLTKADTFNFLTMATRLGERASGFRQLTRPVHRMSWLSTARLPRPHDPARRDVAWMRWNEQAVQPDALATDPAGVALLDALFGNSPYLTETALQNPTFMTDLWHRGPDAIQVDLSAELDALRAAARGGAPPASVATSLRRLKRRVALNVAVADIAQAWALDTVTGALSAFAAGCLGALTDSILLQLARDGQLAIGARSRGCGAHRARHGQARRRRAQLLERHRPDPALRPRRAGTQRQRAGVAPFRARRPAAGPADVGDLGRRLYLPHRSAGCGPTRARRRWPCRSRRPSSTTRASARTGSAPP